MDDPIYLRFYAVVDYFQVLGLNRQFWKDCSSFATFIKLLYGPMPKPDKGLESFVMNKAVKHCDPLMSTAAFIEMTEIID